MFTIAITIAVLASLILGIILGRASNAARVERIRGGYRKLLAMTEKKFELECKPLHDKIARLMHERHKGIPSQYRARIAGTDIETPLFTAHARYPAMPQACTVEAIELFDKDDETKTTVHTVNFGPLNYVCTTVGDELNVSFPLDIGSRLKL